jgi:superfamily I DNA/RNA helicase
MKPSVYQQAIFDFIANENGSAVIEAVAGSGKTTTVVQSLNLIPKEKSVLMLAFNKSIADELKSRVPAHVDVKTFNGLGHNILGSRLGRLNLDSYKMRNILKDTMDSFDYQEFGDMVYQLTGYARRLGLLPSDIRGVPIIEDTKENWVKIIDHFGMPIESFLFDIIISYSKKAIINSVNMAAEKKVIDFDDQIYIPAIKNMRGNSYDFIFVDEAQDVSPVRTKLIQLVLKEEGRVIAVGDSRQAIYGFTGSDAEAMNTLRNTFNAISLPLSISYRCAKNIVNEAKKIIPEIEASDTANQGEVIRLDTFNHNTFNAGDMIICRKNAPIVSLCFKLISNGIPARVMGRDISSGLIKLIEKLKAKGLEGKHGLREKLIAWETKEVAKWNNEDRPDMVETIKDKVSCIFAVLERTSVNTVPDLIRSIESMFSDDTTNTKAVTLSSIHKSKGLEADTVYFLDVGIIPLKSAKQKWQLDQEYNLEYVGITRAKNKLIYINSPE